MTEDQIRETKCTAVPMRINVEVQLTVMASVLYRLLGARVGKGYEKAEARTLFRDLARHAGNVTITHNEITVQMRAHAKDNYLIAAGYPDLKQNIPWLNNKTLRVEFNQRP